MADLLFVHDQDLSDTEHRKPKPDNLWMIIGIDESGEGWILGAHSWLTANELIESIGACCSDQAVEFTETQVGLYRMDNIKINSHKDWETGYVDSWEIYGEMHPLYLVKDGEMP